MSFFFRVGVSVYIRLVVGVLFVYVFGLFVIFLCKVDVVYFLILFG